ncbi:MAG TPA: hypothetical protein VJN01_14260, partial [Xanthomonadales bacterium]|nr:hypothetical protein [Xanthomonadales bacterium]
MIKTRIVHSQFYTPATRTGRAVKLFKPVFLLVWVILSMTPLSAFAATFTTIANGNWNSGATWSGGLVPHVSGNFPSGDTINIHHTVTWNTGNNINNAGIVNLQPSGGSSAELIVPTGINVQNTGTWNIINAKFTQFRFVGGGNSGTPQSGSFVNKGGVVYVEGSIVEVAQDWTNSKDASGADRTFINSCLITGQNFSNTDSNDLLQGASVSIGWHGSGSFQYSDSNFQFNDVRVQLAGTSGNFELNKGTISGDIDYITLKNHVTGNVGSGKILAKSDLNLAPTLTLDAYCSANYENEGVFTGSQTSEARPACPLTAQNFPCVVAVPEPEINLSKTVFSGPTFNAGTGRYTVVYRVSAANTGQGPGDYDLTDTFTPAPGITLFSTSWAYAPGGETETGTKHVSYPNGIPSGGTVVANEGLAAGATETWSVTAEFTVNPGAFDGSQDDCVQQSEQAGDGFYNAVAVSGEDDDPADNDACINLPPPAINLAKTVFSGPTFNGGTGRYTVVYRVSATNTGQGPGVYNLTDTFAPAPGITLFSTAWAYAPGGETQTGVLGAGFPAIANGGSVVSGEALASGASETWSVTAEFTVNPGNLSGAEDDCVQGEEQSGTGFYNAVAVSGNSDTPADNDACVDLPPEGINLQKTVFSGPVFDSNTGRYTVVYNVSANNSGGGPGTYDVVDTFTPAPGLTLFSTAWAYGGGETETGSKHASYPNAVPNGATVVDDEGLAAGASESWTVTAEFTLNPLALTGAEDDCVQGQEQSGTGFYNAVAVSGNNDAPEDNDACVNLPDPSLDLAKTIVGEPQELGPDQWQVTYLITATNTGDGPALFDVMDTLDPGDGINPVLPPTVTYVAIDDTFASPVTAPPGWPLISDNETLAGQRSESWQVVVVFNLDREAENFTDELLCSEEQGNFLPDRGFYNAVDAAAGETDTSNNDACGTPRVIFVEAVAECVNDAPWVTYNVTHSGFNPAPTEATFSWIHRDGLIDTLVSGPTAVPLSGFVLWPDADVDAGGNASKEPGDVGIAWPGWTEAPPGTWTFDSNTNLVPNLVLRVEVNPQDEVELTYPPGEFPCAPPAVLTVEKSITGVVDNGNGTTDITYLLSVSNTGGQAETYDLQDTLDVDEALTLGSVVTPVTYVPGTDAGQDGSLQNPDIAAFNAGNTAIVTGESLNPGGSEG